MEKSVHTFIFLHFQLKTRYIDLYIFSQSLLAYANDNDQRILINCRDNSCSSRGPPSSTRSSWRRRTSCFACWTRSGHLWRRIGEIIVLIAAPAARTRTFTAVDPSSFACRRVSSRKKRPTSTCSSTYGGRSANISRWISSRASASPASRSMIFWTASPSRCASGTNCRNICRTSISSRLSRGNSVEKYPPIICRGGENFLSDISSENSPLPICDRSISRSFCNRIFAKEREERARKSWCWTNVFCCNYNWNVSLKRVSLFPKRRKNIGKIYSSSSPYLIIAVDNHFTTDSFHVTIFSPHYLLLVLYISHPLYETDKLRIINKTYNWNIIINKFRYKY